jgi:2-phosphoglycerate kinase
MEHDWQVLLVGGSGGTGKTELTEALSQRLGISSGQVDDFRLVLQQVSPPIESTSLHYFVATAQVWQQPPERVCERLIAVAAYMSEALRIVSIHHAVTRHPYILEGDGLLPSKVSELVFSDPETRGLVRAVFLVEKDEEQLRRNMLVRGRGFSQNSREEQDNQVRTNWIYGRWLMTEAKAHRLPVLASLPWETLPDRVLHAASVIANQH